MKSKVIDYWEDHLRQEASFLPSLVNLSPAFCSLTVSHPILWTAGANPHEVTKAVVQCKMWSGRYQTASLTKHWTPWNRNGWCPSPLCFQTEETLEHLLLWCPSYSAIRITLKRLWSTTPSPTVNLFTESLLEAPPSVLLKFILDPSSHPAVISLGQVLGRDCLHIIHHIARSWCYSVHRERSRLIGRFIFE